MAKLTVHNIDGSVNGEAALPDNFFAVKPSADLVHQAVVTELANTRNTVAHTKTRGEVRGGGKKPWKQKGTGRARAGSIRSPLWKGGGVTFGPRSSRNYKKSLNRTQFRKSLGMVFSHLLAEKQLYILSDLNMEKISSKVLAAKISDWKKKAGVEAKRVNIVIPKLDKNLEYSGRNLPDVEVLRVNKLSPYRLLLAPATLILKSAIPEIEKHFGSKPASK